MDTPIVHSEDTDNQGTHSMLACKRMNMSRVAQAKDVEFPELFLTQK